MKFCIILLNIVIVIIIILQECQCINTNDKDGNLSTKFTLDLYDEKNNHLGTKHYTYNYTLFKFNEYEEMKNLYNIKISVMCNDEDINNNEKKTILFWTPAYESGSFELPAIYYNAFPIWSNEQKKNKKIFCLKVEDVGWVRNVNDEICNKKNATIPCPDLILLGTTQLAYRYNNGKSLNLEKYFRKYFKDTGKSIESLINKYSYYDYHLDNHWLAVPLIVDFRNFRFNITTFNYCKNKGYDLQYPPPLSDYWGLNYKKTWTWEKAFEYAKIIKECTGLPGFRFSRINSYEDTKFFIVLCQALGIPFLTENIDLNLKECGFRKKEYIEKLSIIKELFENHYIDKWLEEKQVFDWINNKYPKSFENFPKFRLSESTIYENDIIINGMSFSVLLENKYSDIMYSYMPGSSTFLGGAGIIITSDSQYHDELFEYIKVIIDDKYPYFSELNSAVTPFENIHGKDCLSNQTSKKMLCNSLLTSNGTYPYYYYNDKMKIIYLSHISVGSERGISFTTDSSFDYDSTLKLLLNKKFKCDDKADIKMNTITYYDESKIKIPINETNSLIVKQFDNNNNKHQTNNMICSIYDEALKNAKPYQFPYSTFSEISNFEFNAPVSVLLAHLYYNYYETDKNTFEDIVNECCDYMDYSLKPSCKNYDKKKYNITDCIENLNTRTITFLNCIPENNKIYKAECSYIPYKNEKGIILQICLISSLILNLIYLTIILIYRNEKCINMGGLQFLLGLIISSIILNISIFFWIGKQKKFKCILKFWTIIIGMTGFISSYSIKAQIIISLYNNLVKSTIIKKVNNNNYKSYILYIIFSIVQLFLLTFWTFTQKGVETKQKYLEDVGYYDYTYCSLGNETLLIIIFGFDYILLVLSIILAYRGRQIPSAYNESKKIFITSLISFLLLTLCYVSMVLTMKKDFIIFGIALFVIITSLIIVSVFVISKLLVIFNINIQSNVSVVVLNKDDNMDNIDRIPSLFLTR